MIYLNASNLHLFANDSKIMEEASCINDTLRLQDDINNSIKWCNENLLHFNPDKCEIFTISRSPNPIYFEYLMDNRVIKRKKRVEIWVHY